MWLFFVNRLHKVFMQRSIIRNSEFTAIHKVIWCERRVASYDLNRQRKTFHCDEFAKITTGSRNFPIKSIFLEFYFYLFVCEISSVNSRVSSGLKLFLRAIQFNPPPRLTLAVAGKYRDHGNETKKAAWKHLGRACVFGSRKASRKTAWKKKWSMPTAVQTSNELNTIKEPSSGRVSNIKN